MKCILNIGFLLLAILPVLAQTREMEDRMFQVKGSVLIKENNAPISGVEVSSGSGQYTRTNALGEFKIQVRAGEELVIRGTDFETVRRIINSDEDIKVMVEGADAQKSSTTKGRTSAKMSSLHKVYLDSARYFKKNDIERSVDFITRSIAELGPNPNNHDLAVSLATLGEVYQYYQQYDLAIESYSDAMEARKITTTALALARVYVLNKNYEKAIEVLTPMLNKNLRVPYQRVELYEILGDAHLGQGNGSGAISYFQEGLQIAKKNQIAPKVTDLNSKIGDAYAQGDRLQEAEAFYGNSLRLSDNLAPQRSIREKEKVADYYNRKNKYDEEIQMRKQTLNELIDLGAPVATLEEGLALRPDSITSQRINYKIANAYIAQRNFDEAIPYLQRSIVEADVGDDLVVQKDATRKLSEVYRSKGDYTKALETYQKYVAVVDTLYVRKEQEISRAARMNRDIALRQSRISGLEQERELSQSRYDLALTQRQLMEESNKRQKWIIYSLVLGLLLTALATFFLYRSARQQKLANNLLALKSLRSQMNPHFIFNALNSVNNFISKNDERSANRYLSDFSTLMRAVLENSEEDFITLSKEMELLKLYLKLEHSRFPEKFDYTVTVDDRIDLDVFQIPPMLLQPYIENAIWHGLRYKEKKGNLDVELSHLDDGSLSISIIDDGIGRKRSAQLKTRNQQRQKSKGMGNVKKRIAILNTMYKDRVDVLVSDLKEDGTGTKVVLTLKKEV
ncbi:MAG: histidine kinase [Flavobacteriaceae bacterium]